MKFDYELFTKKPFELDLKSVPKKTFKKVNFDIICSISTAFNRGWDHVITGGRKQNYGLNLHIVVSEKKV